MIFLVRPAVFSLLLILVLTACKKESHNEICNITKITGVNSLSMYGSPDSSIYIQNYQGNKIIKSIQTNNPGKIYESTIEKTFEYSGDTLKKIKQNDTRTYKSDWIITYSPNNSIEVIQQYVNGILMNKTIYSYTNDRLTQLSFRHVNGIYGLGEYDITFTYTGNNVSEAVETFIGTGIRNVWQFTYTDMSNTLFRNRKFSDYFVFPDYYTLAYALSEKLISKVQSPTSGGTSTFNYTLLGNGNVETITETFTATSNNFIRKASYGYTCN